MSDPATTTAKYLSKAIQSISTAWTERQRPGRAFLGLDDPMDNLIPAGLLREAVARHIERTPLPPEPIVVFMDRKGGAEGSRAASTVIEMLGRDIGDLTFIFVAFNTPSRGMGVLLRTTLARKGADMGAMVEVIAHNRPAEGLVISPMEADRIFQNASLAITFASAGIAGLIPGDNVLGDEPDPLISRSDISILSFPDPEYTVANLPFYHKTLGREPAVKALRFWADAINPGGREEIGRCTLGPGGDAETQLPRLLDNAKRRRYRILVEPMGDGAPCGDPLFCPCAALLEQPDLPLGQVLRTVKSAGALIAVMQGSRTR